MNILIKVSNYIKENGILKFINLFIEIIYFHFYKRKFKKAEKIFIKKPFYINGHSYISIGRKFNCGVNLRMEAIDKFKNQKFFPKILIGDDVIINDYVHIGAVNSVIIGNNVLIASKVYISDHNHGIYDDNINNSRPDEHPRNRLLTCGKEVVIEDDVWIGEMVCILPGVRIGKGSIIGAGAIVTKNIPKYSIAVGNPAKVVKNYNFNDKVWR